MNDICRTQERQAMALARTNDPQTSKDAAKRMVDSGELNRQEKWVHKAIIDFIKHGKHFNHSLDFTTKDISHFMYNSNDSYDKCYDICRKRFSGLFNKFKICLTGDRRDNCRVWRLL